MKQFFSTILLAFFVMQLSAQGLRSQLEASYLAYTDAVKTKDINKLKSSMSSASYVAIKNELLSAQAKPDVYFATAPRNVFDLTKQLFLKASEKGNTATSVYYGKDAFKTESVLLIHFIKENGAWKYHSLQNKMTVEQLAKLRTTMDTTFLSTKEYLPDGIVPPTPVEIGSVEVKGMIDILAKGYSVKIKINGIEQADLNKNTNDVIVIGGLKTGVNTIEIETTPVGKPERLMINVAKVVNTLKYEVYSLDSVTPPASVKKEFIVK